MMNLKIQQYPSAFRSSCWVGATVVEALRLGCASSRRAGMAAKRRQGGQALLEGLVAMLILLMLWVGITWLARFQDMALQTSHASRFAAFSLARDPGYASIGAIRQSYFSGPGHQWKDRRGRDILAAERNEVVLDITRDARLPSGAQPGGPHAAATTLRQEWRLEDAGIASAVVSVNARRPAVSGHAALNEPGAGLSGGLELAQFDSYPLPLVRHTAILLDAGHASSDVGTQVRVAQSDLAWAAAANVSYGLGAKISSAMNTVDGAWRRPQPVFDWLGPWHEIIPEHHLR
ncbi:type IV pilus modification PilV family protein [Eoetvoesiella caeni]